MSRTDSEREALLEALLAGELHADDPEVATALAADAELGRDLEERRRVEAELFDEGELMREVLGEAEMASEGPGAERLGGTLSELRTPGAATRGPRWRTLALVLVPLAAAAAVLVLTRPDAEPPLSDRPGEILGDALDLELVPSGEVAAAEWDGVFRWPAELSADGHWRVRAYPVGGDPREDLLWEHIAAEEPAGSPTPGERSKLEEVGDLEWEVVGLDAFGDRIPGARRSTRVTLTRP